jgi:hypothetical protein
MNQESCDTTFDTTMPLSRFAANKGIRDYREPKNRLRPGLAVRRLCLECMGGSSPTVQGCPSEHCILHPYRLGRGRVTLRLMRSYCLHCHGWPIKDAKLNSDYKDGGQAWARDQARNCTGYDCPFWPYRPGTRPYKNVRRGKGRPYTREQLPVGGPESTETEGARAR